MATSLLRLVLAALAALAFMLIPLLRPASHAQHTLTVAQPRVIVEHGAGVRWDHETPPSGLPDSEEAPQIGASAHRPAAAMPASNLLLLGAEVWEAAPQPPDLESFAPAVRLQLISSAARLRRTSAAMAILGYRAAPGRNLSLGHICPAGCRGRGRCDQLLGRCVCRHGYRGDECEELVPQLCNDPRRKCIGRDCHEWTRFVSRCSGECDLTANRCTCGPRSAYPNRHMFMCEWRGIDHLTQWQSPGWAGFTIVEPYHFWSSPNTTPPWFERAIGAQQLQLLWQNAKRRAGGSQGGSQGRRVARSMGLAKDGQPLAWCDRPPTADAMRAAARLHYPRCGCYEDRGGPLCQTIVRSFCLNQCSDRGACVRGFCQCAAGWSGSDCSIPIVPAASHRGRMRSDLATASHAGAVASAGARASPSSAHAMARVAHGGRHAALRPAIYVYELPVWFNGWLHETRMHPQDCTYRRYEHGANGTEWENYAFGLELALHEVLLASPHRTLNPEAADFFFVPAYGGCYISRFFRPTPLHTLIINENPDDWKAAPVRGNFFYREALQWIRTHHPYWNRTGGRDHLFAFPHDEGACVAPVELRNATLLTSWGRLQRQPQNATTTMVEHSWYVPAFVKQMYASLHCYDPSKDILLPVFTSIKQIARSPHVHRPRGLSPKRWLFHWRGQVLYHFPNYSFGIRQQVCDLYADHQGSSRWQDEGFLVSDKHSRDYLDEMASSTFCGVFPGNGWGHIETPILLGCIPVVVQDAILTPWENVLAFSSYALRLPRADLPRLPQILRRVPQSRIHSMQQAMSRVWERFTYSSLVVAERQRRCTSSMASPHECSAIERRYGLKEPAAVTGRDAIDTLMQVLKARLLAQE